MPVACPFAAVANGSNDRKVLDDSLGVDRLLPGFSAVGTVRLIRQ